MLNHQVPPIVSGLLRASGPAAIGGRVGAVVVDPVKLQAGSVPRGDVGDERMQIVPPLAYSDASAPVVWKAGALPGVAAAMHVAPNLVERMGPCKAMGALGLVPEAPAAFHAAGNNKVCARNVVGAPALAPALKVPASFYVQHVGNGKAAVNVAH